jgi:hypothetical protein
MAKTKKAKAKAQKFDFRTIKSFEDACFKLNLDPLSIPSITGEFEKPIIAAYQLMVIFKAINNGWIPDWSNWNQYKYYPWLSVLSSGFGFSSSVYDFVSAVTCVGSRLCTDSSEKALYIAEQFKPLYEDFFLLK